jgi:hypothetical protein
MKNYLILSILIVGIIQSCSSNDDLIFRNDIAKSDFIDNTELIDQINSDEIKYAYSMESNWQNGYYFSIDEIGRLNHITPENPISEETWFLDEILIDDSPELYYSEHMRLGGYLHQHLLNDRVKSITYFAGLQFVGAIVRFISFSNEEQAVMIGYFKEESSRAPQVLRGYCEIREGCSECFVVYSTVTNTMSCSCGPCRLVITRI